MRLCRMNGTFTILSGVLILGALTGMAYTQDRVAPDDLKRQTVLPYAEQKFSGNIGTTFKDSDPAQFPKPISAPEGAPNVLLILLDDVGFGQFSVSGGGVPAPAMEELAAEGVFYNRFHTTAVCSPTRAALLTGRNHHVAGTGNIGDH